MVLTSKVGLAKPSTKSLRTTIPEGIAEFLALREGDKVEWLMAKSDSGRWVVEVRRARDVDDE